MKKKCESCGKEFHAIKDSFKYCPECYQKKREKSSGFQEKISQNSKASGMASGSGYGARKDDHKGSWNSPLSEHLKLDGFFSSNQSIRHEEVYRETSEGIAQEFMKAQLKASSIRRFYECVRAAYERYLQNHSFEEAKESIYRLRPLATRSETRGITKRCFTDFMKHYIDVTVKSERNLRGFKELFMSVICYMKND